MATDHEIQTIHERNQRVDRDKAWERSITRRSLIALLTYCIAAVFLFSIGAGKPMLNAFIPAIGYILSTLSLPVIKKIWLQKIYRNLI